MDPKRIVALVVGAAVMVLIFSALLVPIINDATTTEKTFENTGMYYMTDDDDYTLVYDPTGKFIVNGVDIPFTNIPTGERCSIVSTEEFMLRFANVDTAKYSVSLIDADNRGNLCDSDDAVTTTFTFNNGTLTITKSGSDDATFTYTEESFRGIVKEGKYVMTKANTPTRVNSDTTIIIGNGTTQVAHWYDRFYIVGTVEDMTVTPDAGITVSNIVVNSTPISGYVDLVEFTSVQFTATDGGDNTVNATYNRVIVPAEVTAELAVHPDSATNALLSAIPIIAMIGIVLAVVGVAIVGRNDY